jgi:hypothetical protein
MRNLENISSLRMWTDEITGAPVLWLADVVFFSWKTLQKKNLTGRINLTLSGPWL